jgi:transcription antitermination factor NusB
MDKSIDRRTQAREIAMQALYQLDVQGLEFVDQLNRFVAESTDDDLARKLASEWTLGTWNNLVICDELITTAAIKWDMSRLSSVDKSILRLAAYQMRFCSDIPKKVIINEAIEIAKRFSGEQAPRFVNGVLDAILRRLKT